ncbi:cell wall anchor protein [Microbacterium sp. CH12i]|uniref:DUF4184 family protein n=1 Tax=Microbacterium sp. CH12i TaxID=1479651 RepID=UPI000460B99E|nr:DUF4184 family protein [Microbacterium sp. CH12i]KDA06100.1 cell wall anchor protein [Microbacterium sp. CH12i]
MPFTPSHALIALPFLRTRLVPAAIAIGAMTPDLPLFLRGIGINYAFTHTLGNVVWTALVAFGLFLIWRVLLRPAVGELSPGWLASRLPAEWGIGSRLAAQEAVGVGQGRWYPLLLAASLLLGVASHIAWDLFTHADRLGSRLFPVLAQQWGPLQGFKWLQHGSSIVALVILGIWALMWLRRRVPGESVNRMLPTWVRVAWWGSLPAILVAAVVFGLAAYGPFTAEFTPQHLAYRMLPPACAIWGVLTLALCVAVGAVRALRR